MKRSIWTALAVSASLAAPLAAKPLEFQRERVLAFDMQIETFQQARRSDLTSASKMWSRSLPPNPRDTRGIRLHVRMVDAGAGGIWELVVKAGDVEEKYGPTSSWVAAGELWTGELHANTARVELTWNGAGQPPVIECDRYAFRIGPAFPQSVTFPDQRIEIGSAPPLLQGSGRSIARLRIMTSLGEALCTGFLVGPDLVLTNEHCVQSRDEARSTLADFGFDTAGARPETLRGADLLAMDATLDYALLRLDGNAGERFGRLPLGDPAALQDRAALAIVQHPGGRSKMLSLDDCVVAGLSRSGVSDQPTDFGHGCDTEGGSSGSPVLGRTNGRVVGLHHFGFAEDSDDPVNQAVKIERILGDLRGKVDAATFAVIAGTP